MDAQMRSRSPEIVAQVYPDLEAASNKVSEASPATTPERPFDFSMVMPGSIDPQIQTPEYVEVGTFLLGVHEYYLKVLIF